VNRLKKSFRDNVLSVFSTKLGLLFFKTCFSILIARVLGAEGKGAYTAIMTFVGSMVGFCSLGINDALTYYIAHQNHGKNYFIILTKISVLIATLTALIMFTLESTLQMYIFKDIPKNFYKYTFMFIFFIAYNNLFSAFIKGIKNWYIFNSVSIFISILRFLLVFVAFFFIDLSTYHIIVISLLVTITNSIVALVYLVNQSINKSSIKSKFKYFQIIKYGLKSHLGSLFSQLEYQTDVFLLLIFLSPSAVGFFSVAYSTSILIRYITNSLNNVLFSDLSSIKEIKIAIPFQNKVLRVTLFINGIASLLIIIVSYPLIFYGYGKEFSISFYLLFLIVPGTCFDSLFRVLLTWYKSTNRPLVSSIFTLVSLLINIILYIILLPLFGIWGAAISVLATFSMRSLAIVFYFSLKEGVALKEMLIIKHSEVAQLKYYLNNLIRK